MGEVLQRNIAKINIIALAALISSAALWIAGCFRESKLALLGQDHSHRLQLNMEGNLLLALLLAAYFFVTRKWVAGAGAVVLLLAWILFGIVNSAPP